MLSTDLYLPLPKNNPSDNYANDKQRVEFINAFHTCVALYKDM